MKTFVVLTAHGLLERACSELSVHFGFIKRHHALWLPDEMLGMWVGPEPEVVLPHTSETDSFHCSSPRRLLHVHSTVGISGLWTMCYVDDSSLTRVRLLDELVGGSSAGTGATRGSRFLPVFPRSTSDEAIRSEVSRLSARYPDEVCPPLFMNPMTGALSRSHIDHRILEHRSV
ncbi:MAG: hypothetical protein FJ207_15295 [Gemmatimonadetes bacterium]|nr:hypothetical protein [Gemmatimonadota bacterium]